MTQPKPLTELLQQLHGALAGAPSMSEQDRELLKQLSADIQGALEKPGAKRPEHASLATQLEQTIVRLEVTHPEVTGVLMQVSKALGDMGI